MDCATVSSEQELLNLKQVDEHMEHLKLKRSCKWKRPVIAELRPKDASEPLPPTKRIRLGQDESYDSSREITFDAILEPIELDLSPEMPTGPLEL